MTNEQNENSAAEGRSALEGVIMRCTLTRKELQDTPLTDDFSIARMLVSKGFKADGGPLQPRLRGQIGYTVDFETGDYRYFQMGA